MPSATKLPLQSMPQEDDAALAMALAMSPSDEDDDFQNPIQVASHTQKRILTSCENLTKKSKKKPSSEPLNPSNVGGSRSAKRPQRSIAKGKENPGSNRVSVTPIFDFKIPSLNSSCGSKMVAGYDSISIEMDRSSNLNSVSPIFDATIPSLNPNSSHGGGMGNGYSSISIETNPSSDINSVSRILDVKIPSSNSNSSSGDGMENGYASVSIETNRSSNVTSVSPIFGFKIPSLDSNCGDEMGNDYASMLIETNRSSNLTSASPIFDLKIPSSDSSCGDEMGNGYASVSIKAGLLESQTNQNGVVSSGSGNGGLVSRGCLEENCDVGFEPGSQLNSLMSLCFREEVREENECVTDEDEAIFRFQNGRNIECLLCENRSLERVEEGLAGEGIILDGLEEVVQCPLCCIDISDLSEELRQVHTNGCLDKEEDRKVNIPADETEDHSPKHVVDVTPVLDWLRTLGLSRYEEAFIREEIDWDTLQWLTEEDLLSLGVTALGPRKKIVHALDELKGKNLHAHEVHSDASKTTIDEKKHIGSGSKLITEYFRGSFADKNQNHGAPKPCRGSERSNTAAGRKTGMTRNRVRVRNHVDIPPWCCIPGTPFRVDAFRCLRGDCSHWFLTHFHLDHYQGLTRGFCHGKIYCSSITARLVNMKIGVPWDRLQVLPLNQRINIGGIDVTCLDANHCPGAIIILFEPPNGKPVLHTGDFRLCEEMLSSVTLESCHIHTLILDTTYCNPQYDFPKQEAVIQFVIEAIQAEAFNPRTLFLIGSYTIGKERLFLEVARVLRKKVYVGAVKLRLVQCLGIPEEDMQWFTSNEMESQIHVVPMWTIASFKRMKYISNRYSDRYNLIVAFSPTGWTFGKGRKKSPGRRSQQGTIIRYEVPYSEHCSFTELREFVQFISPENIIPSVNNNGPESADAMVAQLLN